MKTIVLGDTHGRSNWKLAIHQDQPNRVIFIGDYFDSFHFSGVEQIDNFKQIIQYKENNPQVEVIYWASTATGCGSIGDTFDRTDYDLVTETVNTFQWVYANYRRDGTLQQYSGHSTAIAVSTTAVINTTYDGFSPAANSVVYVDYGITRNSQIRTGTIKFSLTSGGIYSIDDDYAQTGDVGITFGYNGTDITYTSDGNGTGLLNYALRYHELL